MSSRFIDHLELAHDAIVQVRAQGGLSEQVHLASELARKLTLERGECQQTFALGKLHDQVNIAILVGLPLTIEPKTPTLTTSF